MEKPTELLNEMTDILRDTVRFYSENPAERRAWEQGSCTYWIPETGAKCAIGRLLSEEDLEMLKTSDQLLDTALVDVYDSLTTKKVKKLPIRFLEDLQEFHDNEDNWTSGGISILGESRADIMLEKINTRVYA